MNKQNKKGQTATEYIIIVAVVIVIAVVVASLLGGFPGIGSGTTKNIDNYKLKTEKVAVDNYGTVAGNATIKIRNNHFDTLVANTITVNGEFCDDADITLKTGQSTEVTCSNSTLVDGVTPDIQIVWTDLATDASYTIGESVSGEEDAANISIFSSVIINETNGHVWQAGDSGDHISNLCYDSITPGCLAWSLGGTETPGETCDTVLDSNGDIAVGAQQTSYPACSYCYNLSLCNNGSFDGIGSDCSGSYGGALTGYGKGTWRLPSYIDGSNQDYDIYENAGILGSYFKSSEFTSHTMFYYWTANSNTSTGYLAYTVDIESGSVVEGSGKGIGDSYLVRCVHDQIP